MNTHKAGFFLKAWHHGVPTFFFFCEIVYNLKEAHSLDDVSVSFRL